MQLYFYDYICLAIIIIMPAIGYKKGAISSLLNWIGLIASFVIAWIGAPFVTNWLMNSVFINNVMTSLTRPLVNGDFINSLLFSGPLEGTGLSLDLIKQDSIINQLSSFLGERFLSILVFFLILIILKQLRAALGKSVKKANDVPVLGSINKFCGLFFSGVLGVIIAALLVYFLSNFATVTGNAEFLMELKTGNITGILMQWYVL